MANPTQSAKKRKVATLADVARAAGVVAMTASRAINGTGYVSDSVRQRVMKAAQELNYRPNMLARSLKVSRLHAVGIMLPDIANPFSAELVAGLQDVLNQAGYSAFLATANRSVEQEKAALRAFVDHRVDGILVATRGTELGNETIAAIIRQGVPVVTVGRPIANATVDMVTANHWKGAYEAVTHLIDKGHKRIGFVGVSPDHASNLRRYQGYADALAAHGIPVRSEYVVGPAVSPAYATEQDGYAAMTQLGKLKQRPTAIFARNDYTAIGALRAAQELGLHVPRDLAVASFDNTPLSEFTTPPLTTVAQPITEQGRHAAQFLLDRIEGRFKGPGREVCLECHLIVRASSGSRLSRKAGQS
ncbi:MAG TPA: LacI family DNA-binding transcriptional regulator [Terriglobales bacterium]|nr:LacI family DNA-binding transcriptional regulator [Terriglobales bacterium]